MPFDTATLIGALAAVFSTVSFMPQVWKIIKTRQTGDLSLRMYVITVLGFGLWLGYGALLGQWPLMLSNGLCFLLSGFILAMKLAPQ
ncbi:MAG: SemiSWEET transporter, partial [Oceanibaculum nanhaiense]|nr:SemiSWEET transporter [Oceanibaculum nanhaiense]